jgi:murein L,D-transpeptidase YcbB/YkuD
MFMTGPRYDLILASSGLALILAIPLCSMAMDPTKLAAAPMGVPAAEQTSMQPATAITSSANEASSRSSTDPATATEQTAAPDPFASLDPADRAIAEAIRDLLATKLDRLFPSKKEAAAAVAFYQNRNLAPLWLDKGVENARAASAIVRMKSADSDGLEPSDYKPPNFAGLGPDALAEAELKLTQTVLTFARHLQAGRFPYTRVSHNIELPQASPEPAVILNKIADAADAGHALDTFSPPQEPYRKLKAKLAELRGQASAAKSEMTRQIEIVIANMERWRWYPRDLGNVHVLVNQPDFTLKVVNNGTEVWTTRIVIGKPSMPTPLLSETMKSITVNPTWHVPQSIVHNEYLPALAQDPTVLERMGLRVSYNGGEVQITQPPGEGNALGRVRFNFPNRFSVYQHDTPDKHLFADEVRAYSHGCMRVQDPAKYAEVLLNIARPHERWTAEKIKNMFGTDEQDIQLQQTQIWVHLTYQTAFVDNFGKLQMRRDIYNLDSRTFAAIKSEHGVEPAPERKQEQEMASGSGPNRSPRSARTGNLQSIFYEAPSYARQ